MLATRRAEMADLRRLMAEIEAQGGGKAHAGEPAARRLKLGRSLDPALGGGLADNALSEIVPAEPLDEAAAMGFALALAARFLAERASAALLIGESFASREMGALYGPGLVAHGLPLNRLVFVEAPDASAALWAIEEALKSGGPAVVLGELWRLRGYGLAASRRLLLAARKGRTPALIVLASAHGQAQGMTSAADARFEIAAARSARTPAAAGKDLLGPFALGARLVKARLCASVAAVADRGEPAMRATVDDRVGRAQRARLQALDVTRIVRLEWRSEARCFDDPAISLSLAAASGDRPRAAPGRH